MSPVPLYSFIKTGTQLTWAVAEQYKKDKITRRSTGTGFRAHMPEK
jgi:hypothetical protein